MMNWLHDASLSETSGRTGRWIVHPGHVVRRFRFHNDGLFVFGCAAYGLNRWLLKPHLHSGFLHSHFNDLWLIPCALPLILWLHRRFGWRSDEPPTLAEVSTHVLLWSVLFEWGGPHLMHRATGDLWDVACYGIGGLGAWAWWNRDFIRQRFLSA